MIINYFPLVTYNNPHLSLTVYYIYLFIYLFGVLRRFQHCTGHITTGSWKGRGNQYIEFARVLYCKLPTNGKQLPAFPHKALTGIEPRPQRWEARVLPLCHRGPSVYYINPYIYITFKINFYSHFVVLCNACFVVKIHCSDKHITNIFLMAVSNMRGFPCHNQIFTVS